MNVMIKPKINKMTPQLRLTLIPSECRYISAFFVITPYRVSKAPKMVKR